MIDITNVELREVGLFLFTGAAVILAGWLVVDGAITRAASLIEQRLPPEEALRYSSEQETINSVEILTKRARDLGIPEARYRYWTNKLDLKVASEEYEEAQELLKLFNASLELYCGNVVLAHALTYRDINLLTEEVARALLLQCRKGSIALTANMELVQKARDYNILKCKDDAIANLIQANVKLKTIDKLNRE